MSVTIRASTASLILVIMVVPVVVGVAWLVSRRRRPRSSHVAAEPFYAAGDDSNHQVMFMATVERMNHALQRMLGIDDDEIEKLPAATENVADPSVPPLDRFSACVARYNSLVERINNLPDILYHPTAMAYENKQMQQKKLTNSMLADFNRREAAAQERAARRPSKVVPPPLSQDPKAWWKSSGA